VVDVCTVVLVLFVVVVVIFIDELELELTGVDPVDPMSPHLILLKVTDVPGSFASIVEGFPALLLHGPELPLSSQFIY
jgi:hypothetical protein